MGQKTSPIGFRTGITLGWQSTWFAPKASYGDFLVEDQKIRRYIDGRFNRQMPKGAVAKVEIIRDVDGVPHIRASSEADALFALGLQDPELRVEFEPSKLAARGLNAANLADAVRAWFRDTLAGKINAGDNAWIVRIIGQDADPGYLAQVTLALPGSRAAARGHRQARYKEQPRTGKGLHGRRLLRDDAPFARPRARGL